MPMAFISDVHANLEATHAVFKDLKRRGVTQIYHAGDLVGYGPDPIAVTQELMRRGISGVIGNHDNYALGRPDDFNYLAERSGAFTRKELAKPEHKREREFLNELTPHRYRVIDTPLGRTMIVHGGPSVDSEFNWYVWPPRDLHLPGFSTDDPDLLFDLAEDLADERVHAVVMGHTHVPYYWKGRDGVLANAGSVGQPRDGNPHASYLLIPDRGAGEIIRVPYNIPAVAKKLRALGDSGELPKDVARSLGDRLFHGA